MPQVSLKPIIFEATEEPSKFSAVQYHVEECRSGTTDVHLQHRAMTPQLSLVACLLRGVSQKPAALPTFLLFGIPVQRPSRRGLETKAAKVTERADTVAEKAWRLRMASESERVATHQQLPLNQVLSIELAGKLNISLTLIPLSA